MSLRSAGRSALWTPILKKSFPEEILNGKAWLSKKIRGTKNILTATQGYLEMEMKKSSGFMGRKAIKRGISNHDNLRSVPGVGPRIEEDLLSIGIRKVEDLKGKDPEKLYQKLCRRVGKPVDRCMLYVFRCAVYFASNSRHKPELLKWWNWKDKK